MTPTVTLSVTADRLAIYAEAARRRRKASLAKQKAAERARTLALIYDLRRAGIYVSRNHERAIRWKA